MLFLSVQTLIYFISYQIPEMKSLISKIFESFFERYLSGIKASIVYSQPCDTWRHKLKNLYQISKIALAKTPCPFLVSTPTPPFTLVASKLFCVLFLELQLFSDVSKLELTIWLSLCELVSLMQELEHLQKLVCLSLHQLHFIFYLFHFEVHFTGSFSERVHLTREHKVRAGSIN